MRSAVELIASAPKRYVTFHYRFTPNECAELMGVGRTFYAANGGEWLKDVEAVRAAMKRDNVVESRP